MKGKRNLLWLVPVLAAASAPAWWTPVAHFLRPRGEFNVQAQSPEEKVKSFELDDIVLTQSQGNREEMRLKADRIYTINSDANLELEGVAADLYSSSGDPLHITSTTGLFDTSSQKLTLAGDVRLMARQGYTLQTETLSYLTRARKAQTNDSILMTGPKMEVRGTGMTYDLTAGILTLGGRVTFLAW